MRRDRGGAASHALEDHGGHHQRHDASRRVDEPGRAAEERAGEEDDDGAHQPGHDSVREVTLAQRLKREEAVADAHRNGEHPGRDAPGDVTLEAGPSGQGAPGHAVCGHTSGYLSRTGSRLSSPLRVALASGVFDTRQAGVGEDQGTAPGW